MTKNYYVEGIAHDIFRVTNYPEVKFFDYDSLEKWLKGSPEDYKVIISKEEWQKLKDYWQKYPNSMVKFG